MKIYQLLFLVCLFFSCSEYKTEIYKSTKKLELIDSVRIEIPYEFGFVSKVSSDGYLLAYSYIDELFYVLKSDGQIFSSFSARGEGPKEYSGILPFAGIHENKVFFLDHQNLYFFSLNGDFISVTAYNDPFVSSFGGIPDSELFLFSDGSFIIPNIHIGNLARQIDRIAILDTIPIWIKYDFSLKINSYERSQVGLVDKNSTFFSDLTFNNYKSKLIIIDRSIIQIPEIGKDLFKYDLKTPDQIEKIELDLPGFKSQKGLQEEKVTKENFRLFNQMSAESSFIGHFINLDSNSLFLTYSIKKLDNQSSGRNNANDSFISKFQGFYFDLASRTGFQVDLPLNGSDSFYKRLIYLGENKFLFLLQNELEKDFHIGLIYNLVDS
ncbi:hypothetical protein [Algoriphagus formosus]|uniref:hypothetical protein n=1 Tax=Algoriphagus formosus TaxID=2007308 RepID=UPI0012FE7621|nr:hypothetical protein [Algoriphagus formosus]